MCTMCTIATWCSRQRLDRCLQAPGLLTRWGALRGFLCANEPRNAGLSHVFVGRSHHTFKCWQALLRVSCRGYQCWRDAGWRSWSAEHRREGLSVAPVARRQALLLSEASCGASWTENEVGRTPREVRGPPRASHPSRACDACGCSAVSLVGRST